MSHVVSTMHYLEYVILSKIIGGEMGEKKTTKNTNQWINID